MGAFYSDVQGSAAGGPRDYTSLRIDLAGLFRNGAPVLLGEIESIQYYTNMQPASSIDWQLKIYTKPLEGQGGGWYGHRFNFTRPDNPDGNWDLWSTDSFTVEWIRSGPGVDSYPDELFSVVRPTYETEEVYFIDIIAGYATSSPPVYSYLDAVTITLTDASTITLDLEADLTPDASTYPAEAVTKTSARLLGGVIDDGDLDCEYRFRYWTDGGELQTTPWTCCVRQSDVINEPVVDLLQGTLYWFQLELKNAFGSALGDIRSFSTMPSDIIWVTETIDRDGDTVQDDQDWVDLLMNAGYNVDVRPDYWTALEGVDANDANDYVGELNAADLVIVSRSANSDNYTDGNEPTLWNSITSPMMLMSTHIARKSRWQWFNTMVQLQLPLPVETVLMDPNHPSFVGLPNPVPFYDPNVGTGANIFIVPEDAGNGTILATGDGLIQMAEWPVGVEYYQGAGQFAGDKRMFFAGGTQVIDGGQPQGALNLSAEGTQAFLNAVFYMINN